MKQVSDFLFRNYLDTEEAYEECRDFWEATFQELISQAGTTSLWQEHLSQVVQFGDGSTATVFELSKRWGGVSPVLSKKSDKLGKVLNVTQFGADDWEEALRESPEGWLDVRLHSKNFYLCYSHDTCDVYVLLTRESLGLVRSAVNEWVKADTRPSDLDSLASLKNWPWLKWWIYPEQTDATSSSP